MAAAPVDAAGDAAIIAELQIIDGHIQQLYQVVSSIDSSNSSCAAELSHIDDQINDIYSDLHGVSSVIDGMSYTLQDFSDNYLSYAYYQTSYLEVFYYMVFFLLGFFVLFRLSHWIVNAFCDR